MIEEYSSSKGKFLSAVEAGSQGGPTAQQAWWVLMIEKPQCAPLCYCVHCCVLVFGSAYVLSEQLSQELRELLTSVLGQ